MLVLSAIHKLIENEEFFHYSQGLFCANSFKKIGDEIFLRSKIGSPDMIFREAKLINKLYELETKSILKVIKTYNLRETTSKELLFINIFPSTILHKEFPSFIKKITMQFLNKLDIVFEIIEAEYVENSMVSTFKERIQLLKSFGYSIAIDDVGKGWSSLNMIIELEPHFIKLDRYFSINLSNSPLKQEMIKSLLNYSKFSNLEIVLEGIELEMDLATAKLLGVHICQGYHLDKPRPVIP